MLRKRIKTVLIYVLFMIIGTIIGMFGPVLLCDIWRLPCAMCR